MNIYLETATSMRDVLSLRVEQSNELYKRLNKMGHGQFLAWVKEHTDEISEIIRNPQIVDSHLADCPRRDMLLYASAFVCGLARQLLDQYLQSNCPVSGATGEVVAEMGKRMLALCSCKPAPWPWAGHHPFAQS